MTNKQKFMKYALKRIKRKEQKAKADADSYIYDNMEKIRRRVNRC